MAGRIFNHVLWHNTFLGGNENQHFHIKKVNYENQKQVGICVAISIIGVQR
jgi:hypothetical protein